MSESSLTSELSLSSELSGLSELGEEGRLLKSNSTGRDASRVKLENLFKLVDSSFTTSEEGREKWEEIAFEQKFDVGGGQLLVLSAATTYLNVEDLTACRATCKEWFDALAADQGIWRRCVRRGGVVERTRGDFWLWVL